MAAAENLAKSGDFIGFLKKYTNQICNLEKNKTLIKNEDDYNKKLLDSVSDYVKQFSFTDKNTLAQYVTKGLKKGKFWFNILTYLYLLLSFVYFIFTFSVTINIQNNNGATNQISEWIPLFYVILGVSLIWTGLLFMFLLFWLASSRICGKGSLYVSYIYILLIIIYTFITLWALAGPITRGEQFTDDNSFKYNLTNTGTWVLFGIGGLYLLFKIIASFTGKKGKSNPSTPSSSITPSITTDKQ